MSTESAALLAFASLIKGSSTIRLVVSIVVVVPFTTRLFAITTSFGKPTVIVPELSPTVTSFEVPLNVIVFPKDIAVELLPSATVILLAANLVIAIDASEAT